MLYKQFSLNGAWEMRYQEDKYMEIAAPFNEDEFDEESAAGTEPDDMSSSIIENAVPGYWEDMTECFKLAPFFCKLRINPEYGLQQYPIAGTAPDMALPNIVGNFFYRRFFTFEDTDFIAELHFEGVQNSVSAWINGMYIGSHEGYSTPFGFKIPEGILVKGVNSIELSVSNHHLVGYGGEPVSGLTTRAANEYTGGITGDVEIRVYNSPLRGVALLVSENLNMVTVKTEMTESAEFEWEVYDGKELIKSGNNSGDFTFESSDLQKWCPENPKLYTLKIKCGDACLTQKFGVRRLVADGIQFLLNGIPYYLRGICEHFYFPETIHPNHNYDYYCSIIRTIKKLGFNFIRFHTFIPEEEYMRAADELGVLLHVECPNNTSYAEWEEIVKFCRKHTSVVIYCCGNELLMDEPFIEHLEKCADAVHKNTDALFSPINALRGVEYFWVEPEQEQYIVDAPLKHNARRLQVLGEFSDMYSSYPEGAHSYFYLNCDPEKVDNEITAYRKPRVSHEICIDGTYTDLSLKSRYKDTRVGETKMFDSIESHLAEKGVLRNAPLYFKNSSEWQRRVRKYCFESVRRSNSIAGFDFLGPIDTHWHTFGYDVGMMNEFYELKPGETVRNVLMYNSPTVLLTDLARKANFVSEEELDFNIYVSHYGNSALKNAKLEIRLSINGKVVNRKTVNVDTVENGKVKVLHNYRWKLPKINCAQPMKLYVTLDCDELFAENEWELYVYPEIKNEVSGDIVVSNGMSINELADMMSMGKRVVLLGTNPFDALKTSFRISLAGRTSGNCATVIYDHPITRNMPNEGFCGWQFNRLMEDGKAVCFETDCVPFNPIIEVVSSHKFVIRQAALFEIKVGDGKLIVCGFNFEDGEPASNWFKHQICSYAMSNEFNPCNEITIEQLIEFANTKVRKAAANTNFAFNANDKTAVRKK